MASAHRRFVAAAAAAGGERLTLGLERPDGSLSRFEVPVFAATSGRDAQNLEFAERLVKSLLWQRGACRLLVAAPPPLGDELRRVYSAGGDRSFDVAFMERVFERAFSVDLVDADEIPEASEPSVALGRHLDGCRIGFDLGASDFKVSAVVDGEPVHAAEYPWQPTTQTDLEYHRSRIDAALETAAGHLPRVDAIGGSSAGVWIDDRVRVASIFRGLPPSVFEREAAELFVELGRRWAVPLNIVNDGEVTALAGSMSLGANAVLGIAMGTSQAAGYVGPDGSITGWLNELAFAPLDLAPEAPVDEWSGDRGCGVQYLSQTGVIRLAEANGIDLGDTDLPAEKLRVAQELLASGDDRLRAVFETVGTWLGHAIAYYALFYEIEHVLVLGRVTSGQGGVLAVDRARDVLATEFPELSIEVHLPDEASRRVGQSVAAASLPALVGAST